MLSSPLQTARNLQVPSREEVLLRDHSVKKFWDENRNLLVDAWKEWEETEKVTLNWITHPIVSTVLKHRIEETWKAPEKENLIEDLLQEVSPGVYQFQFFDPEKLKTLRNYLEKVETAKIPLRPPYGIVLNRKGAMLDRRSEGYLAAPSFQSFYQEILDKYMRPISRLLFPEIMGYDTQTFGFSIHYQPEKDTSIRMHTDASSVTLNINLNLPNEKFSGSEVDFHDPITGQVNRVKFSPGTAMIHRGNVAHAAQPITSGERTNLVLWLYGDQMQIPRFKTNLKKTTPQDRWTVPTNKYDKYAPF